MLWSLVKILTFVVLIAALALGAGFLADSPDGIRIAIADTEFTLGPLQAAVVGLVLILAVWLMLKIAALVVAVLKFLNGDETALSRYFDRNRESKGYQAMAEGLMAISSGEGRVAMAKAAKAERFLKRPELTNLLTAQAAEMAGDTQKAETVYKKLLADDRTRFVGVRGILKQRLAEGDTDTALKLAQKAFALKPRHEEIQDTLLQLQTKTEDWTGARGTLRTKLKHGQLPRDVHRRRDAVLALSEVRNIWDDEASIETREAAITAHKMSPELIPAAVLAADAYVANGKPKLAARLLKKAWSNQPHPDLAASFARIAPDENAAERLKRFGTLIKGTESHAETIMLLAELNIAAEDFPQARRVMGHLAEEAPSTRSLALMAAIERGEGAPDAAVRGWLAKALTAPRGDQWVCENCGTAHGEWAAVCNSCDGIDTLAWATPDPVKTQNTEAADQMLPLLVDRPEPANGSPNDVAEIVVADTVTPDTPQDLATDQAAETIELTSTDPETPDKSSSS